MALHAYIADGIFNGDEWLPDHAVITDSNRIEGVVPVAELPEGIASKRFSDAVIVPAFIDLQLYGASGRLFSAYPDVLSLRLLTQHNLAGGTVLCLPTIATNSLDIYHKGIDAIRAYWQQGGQGIGGLHLEGPWLNPIRKGAHVEEFIVSPHPDEVAALLEYGKGVIRMITLAPEQCDPSVVRLISDNGILLSAGHSDATYEQAIACFDAGIPAVTHLFNAMSPFHHRATGLPGAAMDHPSVMASIIPDGIHVDYAALRIAKTVMKERLFAITDAVTETGIGPYRHQLAGNKYESHGILSGSALRMNDAVRNLMQHARISMEEALRMCSLYPARLLGANDGSGRIAAGSRPAMTVLDKELNVIDVITGNAGVA